MSALYRFHDVRCAGSDRVHSFVLHASEIRLLQLLSKDEKEAMVDLAVGDAVCAEGSIEIEQGDRRRGHPVAAPGRQERRRRNDAMPVIWLPLHASRQGRVGWVAENGGLISNLKVWENVTLPLWYHAKHDLVETEQSVMYWLPLLGLAPESFADFMAAAPSNMELWQRKLAGLLRALVQMPRVLVVDAGVFEEIPERFAQRWLAVLEAYAAQGRAVLVLADKATLLPWNKIE